MVFQGPAASCASTVAELGGLPTTVLRLSMVYGPGDVRRDRLMPYVIDSLQRGIAPEVGSGRRRIDWIYVDDVVNALVAAAVEPRALGSTLEIGSGEPRSVRDIVTLVANASGSDVHLRFSSDADSRDLDVTVDPSSACTHLHWSAATDLPVGINRTVAWYARWSGLAASRADRENLRP